MRYFRSFENNAELHIRRAMVINSTNSRTASTPTYVRLSFPVGDVCYSSEYFTDLYFGQNVKITQTFQITQTFHSSHLKQHFLLYRLCLPVLVLAMGQYVLFQK